MVVEKRLSLVVKVKLRHHIQQVLLHLLGGLGRGGVDRKQGLGGHERDHLRGEIHHVEVGSVRAACGGQPGCGGGQLHLCLLKSLKSYGGRVDASVIGEACPQL